MTFVKRPLTGRDLEGASMPPLRLGLLAYVPDTFLHLYTKANLRLLDPKCIKIIFISCHLIDVLFKNTVHQKKVLKV